MNAELLQALMAGLNQSAPAADNRLQLLQGLLQQLQGPSTNPHSDPEKRARAKARARRVLRRNAELERRVALLARALGACDCWGEDPACEHCAGRGRAGAYACNPELFALFVLPAVRASEMQRPHSPAVSPDQEPPKQHPQQEKS